MWQRAHSYVHVATSMTSPARPPATRDRPCAALPAGLGAGGRASRRRPPGLAPGTHRPGQQAAEPADRLDQLGVAHVDLVLLASGLWPLGLVNLIPRVHFGAPFSVVLPEQ